MTFASLVLLLFNDITFRYLTMILKKKHQFGDFKEIQVCQMCRFQKKGGWAVFGDGLKTLGLGGRLAHGNIMET